MACVTAFPTELKAGDAAMAVEGECTVPSLCFLQQFGVKTCLKGEKAMELAS